MHSARILRITLLATVALMTAVTAANAQTSTRSFTWSPAGHTFSGTSTDTILTEDTTRAIVRCPTSDITGTTPNPVSTTATANLTFSRSARGFACDLFNPDFSRRGTVSDVRTTVNLTASAGTSILLFFTRIDLVVTIGFNACTLTFSRQEISATRHLNRRFDVLNQSIRYASSGIGCALGGIPASGTATFSATYVLGTGNPQITRA